MLIALGLLVLFVTLLPFWRSERWWVRGWEFPRLQVAVVALAVAVLAAVRLDAAPAWHRAVLLSSGACFVYQFFRILPYTPLFRREVKQASAGDANRRLRVLSSNVLITNCETGRLLALVRQEQPDVLVTLESDARWQRELDTLTPDYPHAIKHPLDNGYGMHVYSRLRLEDVSVEFLMQREVPSMHATLVLRSGDRVRAHFLHPAPPTPTENATSAKRDAELVIVAKRVAAAGSGPVIVTGDLNDVAWSGTTRLFRKLSRLLDPRIGRGMFNSFHARWFFIRWPLDHFFHSDHFTLLELRRLRPIGSDHFPILVHLALEPQEVAEQEAPAPEADDYRHAAEKLANGEREG